MLAVLGIFISQNTEVEGSVSKVSIAIDLIASGYKALGNILNIGLVSITAEEFTRNRFTVAIPQELKIQLLTVNLQIGYSQQLLP